MAETEATAAAAAAAAAVVTAEGPMEELDITHADLVQILEENKTPKAKRRRSGGSSGGGGGTHPSSRSYHPHHHTASNPLLVSPATSQEIVAFVAAATGGLGGGGVELDLECGADDDAEESAVGKDCVGAAAGPTAADPAVLLPSALDTLLRHHSSISNTSILSLGDIGRMACCSKAVAGVIGEAPIWRQLFERAARSGRPYGGGAAKFAHEYDISTVCGEDRLLACFAHPRTAVMEAVGWKKAAACLLGKTCAGCDELCALANPITMVRRCATCSEADPSSYLINKTNARNFFCLADSALQPLRSAPYENKTPSRKDCTSTLYLLSEVRAAAVRRYGSADGLAAEIVKRRTAALDRYERSQSTSRPQKKRPKIERMPDRPGDEGQVKRVMFPEGGLPIGTCTDLGRCAMHHSVCCGYCSAMGSVEDIHLHEKLAHRNKLDGQ